MLGRPQDLLIFLQPFRPALLLTALTLGSLVVTGHGKKLSQTAATPEAKLYLLFFAVMVIGIPFAFHRRFAFDGVFVGYLPNLLYFLAAVCLVDSVERLRGLLWVACLSALLYSLGGYVYGTAVEGRQVIYGEMFDPNDIAYVLVSLFPLSLPFLYRDQKRWQGLVAVISVCSSIGLILLTGSRGGLLGLAFVTGIVLLTGIGGLSMKHKLSLIVMMGLGYIIVEDQVNWERYLTLGDIESDYNLTDEFGRMQIWSYAIDLTLSNPLTGVGVSCFPMALGYLRESWAYCQSGR